jgi:hypothetical protein
MCDFGRLYRLSGVVDTGDDQRKELYKLAATNGNEAFMILAVRDFEGKVELNLCNSSFSLCRVSKTLPSGNRGKGEVYSSKDIDILGGKLLLSVGKGEIYSISFFN